MYLYLCSYYKEGRCCCCCCCRCRCCERRESIQSTSQERYVCVHAHPCVGVLASLSASAERLQCPRHTRACMHACVRACRLYLSSSLFPCFYARTCVVQHSVMAAEPSRAHGTRRERERASARGSSIGIVTLRPSCDAGLTC
jgi:hypothetical protein